MSASTDSNGDQVYLPSGKVKVAVAAAAAVFLSATVVVALTEQPTWVRWASIAWVIVAAGGLLELQVARVELRSDAVITRSVLGAVTTPYSEIEAVKLEDGQLHLKLRTSSWRHLPAWLSGAAAQSARVHLAKRAAAQAVVRLS